MGTIRSFENIKAWQLAHRLNGEIHTVTSRREFSRNRKLRDQMRRASISISSNIAEGFERGGNKEFLQFLSIAKASAGELRSQLYLAGDAALISSRECNELCDSTRLIGKMIWSLMEYLKSSEMKGMKYRKPE